MADQNFMHTAEIMKAALPFIDSRSRVSAEFFTKILDLIGSLKSMTSSNNMAACDNEGGKVDFEGMLRGIRPLCNHKEGAMIDSILNMFNAKRMFEMYNNFMSTMKTMQEYGGFPFGDSESGDGADSFTNNFKGFNFDTIFGNTGNKDSAEPSFETTDNFNQYEDNPYENTDSNSDSEQSASTGSTNNNSMFDMFKAMIPPEQLSTFENLSMLMNTMSYDNNSKPTDSKEYDNG